MVVSAVTGHSYGSQEMAWFWLFQFSALCSSDLTAVGLPLASPFPTVDQLNGFHVFKKKGEGSLGNFNMVITLNLVSLSTTVPTVILSIVLQLQTPIHTNTLTHTERECTTLLCFQRRSSVMMIKQLYSMAKPGTILKLDILIK